MKKGIFRRTAAGILALSCIFTFASCSGGSKNNDGGSKSGSGSADAEQLSEKSVANSYSSEEIVIPEQLKSENIGKIYPLGNTGKIVLQCGSGKKSSYESGVYIVDNTFTDVKKIDIPAEKPKNGSIDYSIAVMSNGNIAVICTISDYGNVEPPNYDDPDFNYDEYDFDALNESTKTSYKIIVVDSNGELVSNNDITCLDKYMDKEYKTLYFNSIYSLGEDSLFFSVYGSEETKNLVMSLDGKTVEELEVGEKGRSVDTAANDQEGNIIFSIWGDDGMELKVIDAKTKKVSDEKIELKDSDYFYSMTAGSGAYRCYMSDATSLYGLKNDGTVEEVINWIDSDINGQYILSVISISENEFITYEYNYSSGKYDEYNDSRVFSRLTKRDPSEIENTTIISMALMYDDPQVTSMITKFNKSSDKYRIKVDNYGKYLEYDDETNQTLNSPEKQFKLDLVAGKQFDILFSYSNSTIAEFAPKGVFVDLYDFLGKNGSISKDEICENVIANNEIDGKLYSITPSFDVTTLAVKSKFYDKPTWTLEEFMKTYEGLPKDMKVFSDNSKDMLLESLTSGINVIDTEKNTCNFNSPELVSLLEFINKEGGKGEINWDTATDDEMEKYWQEEETANKNDKALLRECYLSDLREYARMEQGYFGDKINLVGYPGAGGNGAVYNGRDYFAIMSGSENKEACWDFINTFLSEEYQDSDNLYDIPVRKSSLEKRLDKCMEKPYYIDEDGKKQEYDDTVYIMDKEIKIKPITKEQRDFLEEYILGATSRGLENGISDDISNIITEEVEAFFNKEKSAQEICDILQSRISIILSEKS